MYYQSKPKKQTIDDCLKPSDTVTHLTAWSTSTRTVGIVGAIAIIVVGFIISVTGDIDESFELFWAVFFPFLITAFCVYAVCEFARIILSAIADICHNTGVTARLTEYMVRKSEPSDAVCPETDSRESASAATPHTDHAAPTDNRPVNTVVIRDVSDLPKSSGKKCPSRVPVNITKNTNGDIVCPICGTTMPGDSYSCITCRQKFINGQPMIPYWCASCGTEGPFTVCPNCGGTEKIHNTRV